MNGRHPASFRDPAGFIFSRDGTLYRQVSSSYKSTFDAVTESGLYATLISEGLLVGHEVSDAEPWDAADAATVLRPARVPFITYPHEWCPGQLHDAAMATLRVQQLALDHGFTLKDASAYNVQFVEGRPTLIDTLSFEPHVEGKPWVAYGQFCRHFLAPLALASRVDPRLIRMAALHIDGIPLDLARSLLPRSSRLGWGLGVHLHAHAASQQRHADKPQASARPVSTNAVRGLVESLRAVTDKQQWSPPTSVWSDYYAEGVSYSADAMHAKQEAVGDAVRQAQSIAPIGTAWDLGANTGRFSSLVAEITDGEVMAMEFDVSAVEIHWRNRVPRVTPMVVDLTNPSPGIGWAHAERASLLDRGPADLTMALALVHHLAIANNVPLQEVLHFIALTTRRFALVEWVPKSDPMVERMLASREDIFTSYTETGFRQALGADFSVISERRLEASDRVLFLLEKHTPESLAS